MTRLRCAADGGGVPALPVRGVPARAGGERPERARDLAPRLLGALHAAGGTRDALDRAAVRLHESQDDTPEGARP